MKRDRLVGRSRVRWPRGAAMSFGAPAPQYLVKGRHILVKISQIAPRQRWLAARLDLLANKSAGRQLAAPDDHAHH